MHSNPTPRATVRLSPKQLATVRQMPDLTAATAATLAAFEPHPTRRAGVTAMVATLPRRDLAAVLDDLDALIDVAIAASDSTALSSLYTVAVAIAQALGTPIPTVKARMSARVANSAHVAGDRMAHATYAAMAEASTQAAVALRSVEDAEVIPDLWPTAAGVLERSGMRRGLRHRGLPGFALLVHPMPTHLLPPPGASPAQLADALRSTPHLERIEAVANLNGGPAAAARAWVIDFLALCRSGPDPSPALAAESRRLAAAAWDEVVVPLAEDHVQRSSARG